MKLLCITLSIFELDYRLPDKAWLHFIIGYFSTLNQKSKVLEFFSNNLFFFL